MCGEAVDSAIFYSVAFYGTFSNADLITLATTQYVLKVLWEALSTPLTYWLVRKLKTLENEDYFDHSTNFTPFTLKT
jgi:uncharacterized PurR-regulated membrane protein YhhQ (DUF165 family)